jgi:hypothetical protein
VTSSHQGCWACRQQAVAALVQTSSSGAVVPPRLCVQPSVGVPHVVQQLQVCTQGAAGGCAGAVHTCTSCPVPHPPFVALAHCHLYPRILPHSRT